MANSDAIAGARAAFGFYGAYLGTVAQEFGMDRGIALQKQMCETAGAVQGRMMKQQAGVKAFDAKRAYAVLKAIPGSLGIETEVLEATAKKVRFECKQCAVYEGLAPAGFDAGARETFCREGSMNLMNAAARELNPGLSCRLAEFRSSAEGCCEEEVTLA